MEHPINHICIFGIGGIGGYVGGVIAHQIREKNDRSRSVSFIARGTHLEAIKKNGLQLSFSDGRSLTCIPTIASDTIHEIPAPDLVFICTKSCHLPEIGDSLAGLVHERTIVIPLLNGIDIHARLTRYLPATVIFPGTTWISAHKEQDGIINHNAGETIVAGRLPHHPISDPQPLLEFFQSTIDPNLLRLRWADDPLPEIWRKYLFIAPVSLIAGFSGKTIGGIMDDPRLRGMTVKIMREIVLIAKSNGIIMPENSEERILDILRRTPPGTIPSYARDLEAGKNMTEGDLFAPTIIRLGKEMGIATPATESLYGDIEKQRERLPE